MSPREASGIGPLTAFAAAMSRGSTGPARRALAAARRAGAGRVAAEETALMLMLHAGYPAALEGARLLGEEWPGRARRSREGGPAALMRRGERLCARIYGPAYAKLRHNVARLHPDLATWMIEQGYGRVLARPGLSGVARELVAVAVLAAGGWERQLVSHLLGAARLGGSRAEIRRAWRAGARHAEAGGAAATRAWRKAFGPAAATAR
ncbi:MAG TPA: carboxymuconolactone decarboxylase family protein [Candidatus Eisenbacteria bacterium]